MTEKEKEFSRAKCNVFREVVIFLILIYEKTLEGRWMEALADIQHCYSLLGTSIIQSIASSAEIRKDELNLNLVRGRYHFNELKRRRADIFHDVSKKRTEKDPVIKSDDEISKTSQPPKHIMKGKFGSHAEIMVQHSKVKVTDQAIKAEIVGSEQYCKDREVDKFSRNKKDKKISIGSVLARTDNEVSDEKVESCRIEVKKCPDIITEHQSDRAHEDRIMVSSSEDPSEKILIYQESRKVLENKKTSGEENKKLIDNDKNGNEHANITNNESKKQDAISEGNSTGNAHDPDLSDAVLDVKESNNRNERGLNNRGTEAGAVKYDNSTITDMDEEKATGRDTEAEKQVQRMAALEYIINATLAHMAYFSESYQEAYLLAKYIEHG
jgi:hypothetical protein